MKEDGLSSNLQVGSGLGKTQRYLEMWVAELGWDSELTHDGKDPDVLVSCFSPSTENSSWLIAGAQ